MQNYVSHYWLGRDNADETFSVLPDGSVDLVIRVDAVTCEERVYGTTTSRCSVPLEPGCHYLGVSFKPGQSRHFLNAAAVELTDTHAAADGMCKFDWDDIPERVAALDVFSRLDAVLRKHIEKHTPLLSPIDASVQCILRSRGALSIAEPAAVFGRSLRQFERVFRETVGLSAKLFAQIVRFRQASALIGRESMPLAQIAADLGYSDQSHMSREFQRFAGLSPAAQARNNVVFVQDLQRQATDT